MTQGWILVLFSVQLQLIIYSNNKLRNKCINNTCTIHVHTVSSVPHILNMLNVPVELCDDISQLFLYWFYQTVELQQFKSKPIQT